MKGVGSDERISVDLERKGIDSRQFWWERRPWVVATLSLFALGYAWCVWNLTDFRGDDLDHFLLLQKVGFWQFLSTPIDVHRTPLHRLLTWLVYEVSPMNFLPALLIMLTLHGGTLIYLYRSLRLVGGGGSADVVVCCYAASILVIYGMIWWAHAQHRMPYVLLDTFAVYHYLLWLRRSSSVQLAWSILAIVLAFGFYEKAALIPLHMLVLGACAFPSDFRAHPLRYSWPPLALGMLSMGFSLSYLHADPASSTSGLESVLRSELVFIKMLVSGASGILLDPSYEQTCLGLSARLTCIAVGWGSLFLLCLWRARTAGLLWLVMLATLAVDYLPIALSNRIPIFGDLVLAQYRFHYEELHVVALFMGLISARVCAGTSPDHSLRFRILGTAMVAVFAVGNLASLHLARRQDRALQAPQAARRYMKNLRAGLAQIYEPEPYFDDSRIPAFLSIFGTITDTKTLVPLFVPSARFAPTTGPAYEVDFDGRVVRKK